MAQTEDFSEYGKQMWSLAKKLFPICRSLTGKGVRETLQILNDALSNQLKLYEIPTGTKCFDWEIPKEWNVKDAYILTPDGEKICDFKQNNLHLMGYSIPFQGSISLEELQHNLYSLESQPDVIPYVTSYYKERWGFCLTHKQKEKLKKGTYKVFIDSELKNGVLNYAEVILPGQTTDEIFISTYICHPSMANNELSGPVVTTQLLKWLMSLPKLRYTVRAVFIPETIGSIAYLSKHIDQLKKNVKAGFIITCVGDERAYSFLPSRNGHSLSDRAALHTLKYVDPQFKKYSFLDRGSDERQYCSPGVDLPMATIMRSKYGEYPEYHTSADNLELVTPKGLEGGYTALRKAIELIERNEKLLINVKCEPQLGKRGLYPTISTKESGYQVMNMMNLLAYADGRDLIDIAETIHVHAETLYPIVDRLKQENLLKTVE